jgi:hypothetical protein
MDEQQDYWRKCTSCKGPIAFNQKYWICSVSTCNRVRTGLFFCSVACFDAHVPVMNHRDSGALEKTAPTKEGAKRQEALERAQERATTEKGPTPIVQSGETKHDILVVVSKTKDYVRAASGFNTSDGVMPVLSDRVRALLDEAIRRAAQDGRKTVMDRDFG